MEYTIVIVLGMLTFICNITPGIPAKYLYKNTKDIKRAKREIRTTLGIVSLLMFIISFIKYIY